jgi:hypothetical protein
LFAADQAGYDHMWFATLLNADTTVLAWVNKAFTMPANHAPVLGWQSHPCSHSDFPRDQSVALSQFWFFTYVLFSQPEKSSNPLQGHLSSFIHLCSFPACIRGEDMKICPQYLFFVS